MELIAVTCFCHIADCHQVFGEVICHQRMLQASFSDSNISQDSVATRLRCGGTSNDLLIANFLLSVSVK